MTEAEPTRLAVCLSIDQGVGLSALQLRLAIDEVREIWSDVGVSVACGKDGELSRPDEATTSLRVVRSPAPHRDGAERVLRLCDRHRDWTIGPAAVRLVQRR
jgi:hypothetical protein